MSFTPGQFNCPSRGTAGLGVSSPRTQRPLCDYAEAAIWQSLGGGWTCLYGCFCQGGVSIEWHDFPCAAPMDWARSFHPDSVEICLNLSGNARLGKENQSIMLGPRTVAIYSTIGMELPAWRVAGERHRFLSVEFSREFLERHLHNSENALHPLLRQALRPSMNGAPRVARFHLTSSACHVIEGLRHPHLEGAARRLWYQSKALEFMAEYFYLPETAQILAHTRPKQVVRERVEHTVQILGQRLAEPPGLEELGREVGCSPYHLSRTFSREMGQTIPQYLRHLRMERAAELLKSGKFNVTETALEVGYSSLSHFSRAFCETMGCCPALYPYGRMAARAKDHP